ncbi:hypothetical protein L5G28_00890 [Gordonia sp. HY285]|uniref:hypothetical protein n=1 Tax=Gordonia liuliyuniae TaxID=2911517 RepID=UPI001F210879|nr:hypothetical protein [Gordonia liuliyuniae]MCF8608721.1 hypothetical protein [Gordonia liuliyuniae]
MHVIITHVDLGTGGAWKTNLDIGEVRIADDGFQSYAAREIIAKSEGDIDEYPRIIHSTIDEVAQSLVDFHVENASRLNSGRPEVITRECVEVQA